MVGSPHKARLTAASLTVFDMSDLRLASELKKWKAFLWVGKDVLGAWVVVFRVFLIALG